MQPKFNVTDLNLFYGNFQALHHINIEIPERKVTAFIGPSGCGKSTILNTLCGIIKSDSGTYRFVCFDLGKLSDYKGQYVTLSLKYDVTGGGSQRYGFSKIYKNSNNTLQCIYIRIYRAI